MAYLGTPAATKEIINKYGFAFQKKFGQNFLIDSNILENIVSAAGITKMILFWKSARESEP